MNNKKRCSVGFSLLELLVVISIIGILIAIGSVAFSTAQQRGRDSKRRSDMLQVQKAFEQYYAANTSYNTCAVMATSSFLPSGLPTDPQPSKSYSCTGTSATYCSCALLESTGTGNATNSSCSYGTGNYFCVTNLQ